MDNTEVDSRSSPIIDFTVLIAGLSVMFFCSVPGFYGSLKKMD
jgi:hypothetical protein